VPPLDLGNVRMTGSLEDTQAALAEVVGAILQSGAVPVILGGGHETAYGHFLGYIASGMSVGFVNLDAHLDLRPTADGRGHSGSSFRQMLSTRRTPFQAIATSAGCGLTPRHASTFGMRWTKAVSSGGRTTSRANCRGTEADCKRLKKGGGRVAVSLDADVVHVADMPAVAPNVCGLTGAEVLLRPQCRCERGSCELRAGGSVPATGPRCQGGRWAALAVWQFLVGLAQRK
jgi:formiminoglutamase